MSSLTHRTPEPRLQQIALARQVVLHNGKSTSRTGLQAWIERSWQRCLTSSKRPDEKISFNSVAPYAMRYLEEGHRTLLHTARPELESLVHAIASTRCFVMLTNAQGVVIDAHGAKTAVTAGPISFPL